MSRSVFNLLAFAALELVSILPCRLERQVLIIVPISAVYRSRIQSPNLNGYIFALRNNFAQQ